MGTTEFYRLAGKLIGKTRPQARKILSPLMLSHDLCLTQDAFINVGGQERRGGFYSLANDSGEVLRLKFRDGHCVELKTNSERL